MARLPLFESSQESHPRDLAARRCQHRPYYFELLKVWRHERDLPLPLLWMRAKRRFLSLRTMVPMMAPRFRRPLAATTRSRQLTWPRELWTARADRRAVWTPAERTGAQQVRRCDPRRISAGRPPA
eukprot:scaffold327383_cov59-Tisochrysis_lutea.AAC.3